MDCIIFDFGTSPLIIFYPSHPQAKPIQNNGFLSAKPPSHNINNTDQLSIIRVPAIIHLSYGLSPEGWPEGDENAELRRDKKEGASDEQREHKAYT